MMSGLDPGTEGQLSEAHARWGNDGTWSWALQVTTCVSVFHQSKGIRLTDFYNLSVQFSHSVVSDPLRPHGLQHNRLPCLSPTPKLAQTHVQRVGDAIQTSHLLSSPSPPAFNLSQHQGLFQRVSLHQVARGLEFQLQHQSFQ